MSDRVELTDDEREAWAEYAHAHGMHVDFWRDTRNGFIDGLRIQAARVQALTAERDELRARLNAANARYRLDFAERNLNRRERDKAYAERDAARAELATANARCAELEGEVGEWKSEADDQREAFVWANGACQEQATQKWAALAERDALQATLDRISALADECEKVPPANAEMNAWQRAHAAFARSLRAALTPEGTE